MTRSLRTRPVDHADRALEPRIAPRYQVGIYVPDRAMVTNPFRYVQQIVRSFIVRGGRLARDEVRAIEFLLNSIIVQTDKGTDLQLDLALLSRFRQNASLQVSIRQSATSPTSVPATR